MAYDAVIIGAGMSGLAAGIRLAYYEKSVCILERHTTIGGLNSFYRLRGRNHDVGLHALTNYAPPGAKAGPLSKVLRQLRLRWEDFGLSPQRFSTVNPDSISASYFCFTPAVISVAITPGRTSYTSMPNSASRAAHNWVAIATPALLMQ